MNMSYIIPKLGDEYAFIGADFRGTSFLRVVEIGRGAIWVKWENQEDQSLWATCLKPHDFNPFNDDEKQDSWVMHSYSVIEVISEQHKLELLLKHG